MYNLVKFLENINSRFSPFPGSFNFEEPMSAHTSFKTGGPAELWIKPEGDNFTEFAAFLLETAEKEGIPVFILGGGANIVVSDEGIRGIVLDITGYTGSREDKAFLHRHPWRLKQGASEIITFRSGTLVDDAVEIAAESGLSGMEFLAGMPGTIGGALWMNARCYDKEVADIIREVEFIEKGRKISIIPEKKDFSYKKSPFQEKSCLILSVSFTLWDKDPDLIRPEMDKYRKDREKKGHYRFPSAGSVFKNNKAFGKPTGQLIDELGLKGLSAGDAQIAPWHGNIIINRGKARSEEILSLVELAETRVKAEMGFDLEREIIFIGKY